MNTNTISLSTNIVSNFIQAISSPTRLDILLAIGQGEACVCHLEAVIGQRQAYISQHLMALREAGIITSRREGRFVFYSLQDKTLLDLICQAGELAGIHLDAEQYWRSLQPYPSCSCPKCIPNSCSCDPEVT